jgi:hypothetical protein
MSASNDLQRVKLQIFDSANGLIDSPDTAPAAARPQTLLTQDKSAGDIDVNS